MVAAVIFDVFGTLIEIQNRQHPYRQLLRTGVRQGRAMSPDDLRLIMTQPGGLSELAALLEISLDPADRAAIEGALEQELQSMRVFGEVCLAIDLLRAAGIKIGVCSNLAGAYCGEVRRLLPGLDAYVLSAECGVIKPDPVIYRTACSRLAVEPGHTFTAEYGRVLMIGDSRRCDEHGPRACGITGYHLDRSGAGRFSNLVEFCKAVVANG